MAWEGMRLGSAAAMARVFVPAIMVLCMANSAAGQGRDHAEAWWTKCQAMHDDAARLRCYDASSPRAEAASPPARQNLETPPPSAKSSPVESAAGENAAKPKAREEAKVTYRFQIGYGLGIGGHSGSFEMANGALRAHSGFGSEGDMLTAQFWADNLLAENWSLGGEYVFISNVGKINIDLPDGLSILTDPVTAHAYARLHGHIGFLNAAFYPNQDSNYRPYIGAGFGVGWGSASYDVTAANAFAGSYSARDDVKSVFGALQGFVGMDMFVANNYTISPYAKLIWIPGHPFNLDQRYLDFAFGVTLGRQF